MIIQADLRNATSQHAASLEAAGVDRAELVQRAVDAEAKAVETAHSNETLLREMKRVLGETTPELVGMQGVSMSLACM